MTKGVTMRDKKHGRTSRLADRPPTAAQLHKLIDAGDIEGLALGAGRVLLESKARKHSRYATLSFDNGEGVPMTTLVIRRAGDAVA